MDEQKSMKQVTENILDEKVGGIYIGFEGNRGVMQ